MDSFGYVSWLSAEKVVRRSVVFAPRNLEHAEGRNDVCVEAWDPRSPGTASGRGWGDGGNRDRGIAGEAVTSTENQSRWASGYYRGHTVPDSAALVYESQDTSA